MTDSSTQILSINSSNWSDHLLTLQDLCLTAQKDSRTAAQNLRWEDWEHTSNSLMHAIVKQKRFDGGAGQFDVVIHRGRPVAAGGCYLSDWSEKVMMIGVRTWTDPRSKNLWWHGNLLMPRQLDLARNLGCAAAVMSFNTYNDRLRAALERTSKKQAVLLGIRPPDFYSDLHFLDGHYDIKYTKQSIAVKLITCDLQEFVQRHTPPRYQ